MKLALAGTHTAACRGGIYAGAQAPFGFHVQIITPLFFLV